MHRSPLAPQLRPPRAPMTSRAWRAKMVPHRPSSSPLPPRGYPPATRRMRLPKQPRQSPPPTNPTTSAPPAPPLQPRPSRMTQHSSFCRMRGRNRRIRMANCSNPRCSRPRPSYLRYSSPTSRRRRCRRHPQQTRPAAQAGWTLLLLMKRLGTAKRHRRVSGAGWRRLGLRAVRVRHPQGGQPPSPAAAAASRRRSTAALRRWLQAPCLPRVHVSR